MGTQVMKMGSHVQGCFRTRGNFRTSFPGGSEAKASACNVGDLGSIPGLGRSPGEGKGNLFQDSCLGNPMDGGVWQATPLGLKELDVTAFIWG